MKSNFVKGLLATLILSTVALAADQGRGTFVQKATTGHYYFRGSTAYLDFDVTLFRVPSGQQEAYLHIYLTTWTSWNWTYLQASGPVPLSMLRVRSNVVTVNIPDLRQLGPEFTVSELNLVGPISVSCTVTATPLWTQHEVGYVIQHIPLSNGTSVIHRDSTKYTVSSASVDGEIAGLPVPVAEGEVWDSEVFLQKGDYTVHMRP